MNDPAHFILGAMLTSLGFLIVYMITNIHKGIDKVDTKVEQNARAQVMQMDKVETKIDNMKDAVGAIKIQAAYLESGVKSLDRRVKLVEVQLWPGKKTVNDDG